MGQNRVLYNRDAFTRTPGCVALERCSGHYGSIIEGKEKAPATGKGSRQTEEQKEEKKGGKVNQQEIPKYQRKKKVKSRGPRRDKQETIHRNKKTNRPHKLYRSFALFLEKKVRKCTIAGPKMQGKRH